MFIRIGLVRNEKPKSEIVEEKKGWEVQCLAHNTTITTRITTPLITTCTYFFYDNNIDEKIYLYPCQVSDANGQVAIQNYCYFLRYVLYLAYIYILRT